VQPGATHGLHLRRPAQSGGIGQGLAGEHPEPAGASSDGRGLGRVEGSLAQRRQPLGDGGQLRRSGGHGLAEGGGERGQEGSGALGCRRPDEAEGVAIDARLHAEAGRREARLHQRGQRCAGGGTSIVGGDHGQRREGITVAGDQRQTRALAAGAHLDAAGGHGHGRGCILAGGQARRDIFAAAGAERRRDQRRAGETAQRPQRRPRFGHPSGSSKSAAERGASLKP
jgi:hypothetical protein